MKPGQCRRTEGCAGERTALVNDGPLVGPPIRERNAVQLLSLHLCLPAGNADWLFRPSAVRAADGHGFSRSRLAVFLWLVQPPLLLPSPSPPPLPLTHPPPHPP